MKRVVEITWLSNELRRKIGVWRNDATMFIKHRVGMNKVFADYSQYYDLLYGDKDYHAEAQYVASKLREHRPALRSVVEFGSGTGRHGRLLARAGFDVVGIERSATMLAQSARVAANEGPVSPGDFAAVEGDVRSHTVPGPFDAAISLFHVVSYQTGNDDVLALFRNAAGHLVADGIFLFDVWYGPAVLTLRPETRVKRMANDWMRVTRIAESTLLADKNCVEVNFDVFIEDLLTGGFKRLQEQHLMRYFTTPEIALLAENAGFCVVEAEEWLTRKPPSTNTWGVCYVLRRKAP
jgi:SAM-dependent methyltransferase